MELKYEHLVGQEFDWGTKDCLGLFRAFYQDNFGITITDYARPTNWDADKLNLIEMLYEREGFEKITHWKPKDLRPADVLATAIGSSNPNHFVIYVGDNKILHHFAHRRSTLDTYRPYWPVCFVLRHPDVPDLRPVHKDVTIKELLDARY